MKKVTGETKCIIVALSIEKDLREWIKNELLTIKKVDDLLNSKLIERLKYKLHISGEIIDENELINGADYGECFGILNEHKKLLTTNSQLIFQDISDDLVSIKQVRDRGAHKNLLATDIDEMDQFIIKISKYSNLFTTVFAEIANWKGNNNIENFYYDEELEKGEEIQNNLPNNEFKETGFIRRDKLERRLDQTIKKNSVVVLTGDAGTGKTALLLHKCHKYKTEIGMYDEIKWFTFKTQTFSNNEIKELNKSLKYIDFIKSFTNKKGREDHIKILLEYIQKNKCLIILDNIETVLDQNIVNFIEATHDIDHESKILITSREPIDSGVTVKVLPFDDSSAEYLFRQYSQYLELNMLKKMSSVEIKKLTKSRENNPLGIKLSLDDVYNGTSTQKAFEPNKNFLTYSYNNLFLKLDDNCKKILEMLYYLEEEFTLTTICTYTGIEPEKVEHNLTNLDKKRFLIRDLKSSGTEYFSLRPVIKNFIKKNNLFKDLRVKENIILKHRQIKTTKSEHKINSNTPQQIKYSWDSFYKRKDSDDEAINELLKINKYILSRVYLTILSHKATDNTHQQKLLDEIHSGDQKIIKDLSFLKKKHPNYCEVYRVEGIFYGHTGSIEDMKKSFEKSIELAPDYPNLRAFYIERLRTNSQFEESIKQGINSLTDFKDSIEIKYQLLQSKFFLREFDDLTEELASKVGLKALEYNKIDFRFARKLAKISLEYNRRYAEYLTLQGSNEDFDEAYNQLYKLAENYTKYEEHELIDYTTTHSVIQKSIRDIYKLLKYFSGTEKADVILGIKDAFKKKLEKYMGIKSNKKRDFIKEKFTNIKNEKIFKKGDIGEGTFIGDAGLIDTKLGGFIKITNGVFNDYDGSVKNQIFLHVSHGTTSIPYGAKLSFKFNDHDGIRRKSLVATEPKII